MLDRSAFQARLAANAITADTDTVTLNDGTQLTLRAPNKAQVQRSWAAAGDDEDADFVGMVHLLRWCLIDDEGNPLPHSYAEARGWFDTLDDDDTIAVMDSLSKLISDVAPAEDEDPIEAGKAS